MTLSAQIVLARTLVAAAPRRLPALAQRSRQRLEKLAASGQAAQGARQRALGTSPEDTRALDGQADRVVSALRQRLEAYALLPDEDFPRAERARELGALLFPEGLGFLNLPYIEQLAAMELLVARINEEKLAADLDALCGPEFLASLRAVLPRYRAMVQGGLQRPDNAANLQEHRRKLSAAIVDYATKIAALYDDEDPESLDRIRLALRPIDALRAQLTRRPSAGDATPDPAPADPAPPAPA
ncbi:MAG TPA: hypothetical protein PLW65_10280 [Pseudomonadota bacterium]|nr:hypothetical protein [Pseudomonadota bacterium]